ncbi:MAG: hypothetical protein EBV03_03150 [Proteobacteria bacterium]|nr:hypothetical protein [Pseudomonadota bacterium]
MNFPATKSDSWQDERANLFLVGMPRCGTTALYAYFRRHPQVFASWLKEIQFFGDDLDRYSRISPAGYVALFAGAGRYAWRLDASTTGLMSARAAGEIHAYNPQARIVIGLREPGQWLASMHGVLTTWREEERPFAQALVQPATRENTPRAGCLDYHQYWRNAMALPQQVQRYLEVFGPEQVFVYLLEDLRQPEVFYARLCAWLNIGYAPPQPGHANARETLKYWPRIPNWLSGRARRRGLEALLHSAPQLAKPAYALYRLFRALMLRLLNGGGPGTPPVPDYTMTPQQRQELLAMLDALEGVCGRDLSGWRAGLRA